MADHPLNAAESADVCNRLAGLTGHSLPLATGLELAAHETSNRRVRAALVRLAKAVESGAPLEKAIEVIGPTVGPDLSALIQAGTRSGRLTEVLAAIHGDAKARQYVRRQILSVLVYPTFLLLAVVAILFFTMLFVVPQFGNIFKDFGVGIPALTEFILAISDYCQTLWKPLLTAMALLLVGILVFGRRPALQQLLFRIPLLGSVLRWSSEMSGLKLLGLLTDVDIPLPDALRQVSASTTSVSLKDRAASAASAAERGNNEWWIVYGGETDVANLASLACVGAGQGKLANACFAAADILEGRIRAMMHQVRLVVPATIFFATLFFIGLTVIALFLPMIKLLNALGQ